MNQNGWEDEPDRKIMADIDRKAQRHLRALRRPRAGVWYGLGTMGVVGWSVAVPTLIGIAVGLWLDENVPVSFSWLLSGLTIGLGVGCLNAWTWINTERKKISARREDLKEDAEEDHVV
ncbi:MAG: AtpZ/AtpI family protein [Chloroflexota bacterium]